MLRPKRDKSNKFRVDYAVSSSAENPATFVVTADIDDAHAFAAELISDEIDGLTAKADAVEQERQTAQQRQQVLAMATAKWLLGEWIGTGQPAADCGNGQALWFEKGQILEGSLGRGRWSLAGDQLHMVGGEDNPFDHTGTIIAADPISFTVVRDGDQPLSLRRCTRAETEALPAPTEEEGD